MRNDEEVLMNWLDTLDTADRALRLEGASHKHRENLQAMKKHFNSKLKARQTINSREG